MIPSLKQGVSIKGIKPEMVMGWGIICEIFSAHNLAPIITSCTDGTHSTNSLHYVGRAIDIRSNHIPQPLKQQILATLKQYLDEQFDVILEDLNGPNEHFHIEFDPS